MKNKKIFGIGAVVLLFLTALMPAVSSTDINKASTTSDYEIVSTNCRFDRYEEHWEGCFRILFMIYKLEYTIAVPNENIGETIVLIFVTESDFERSLLDTPSSSYYTGLKEIVLVEDDYQQIYEDEEDIAAQIYTLSLAGFDVSCEGFTEYWKENDDDYSPSKTHMHLTAPHDDGWMFEDYNEVEINGTVFQFPEYSEIYTYYAFPTILKSDYLGWIGVIIDKFLNLTKAFLKFAAEFAETLAIVVVIIGEVTLLFEEVTAFFAKLSVGIPPTEEIEDFLKLIVLLAGTLITFIESIQDLPIDPDDPERVALANSIADFRTYVLEEHWFDDIAIAGEVSKCKQAEIINLQCSDLNENIPGGAGLRTFKYTLESDWVENGPYIFRNCQMTITGNMHLNQEHKSLQKLSYVAPGGRLYCQFGFKGKSRARDLSSFISRILDRFPMLARLFQILNAQPAMY